MAMNIQIHNPHRSIAIQDPWMASAFGISGTALESWQQSRALATLKAIDAEQLVPKGARLLVVAPHPDDEILACGGLLAGLASRLDNLTVVAVTDGEGSHPGSSIWSQQRLREVRRAESRVAMGRLGYQPKQLDWRYLHLPDGHVADQASVLYAQLLSILRPGDVVLSTWRHDGHCDHETVGEVAAAAALHADARLIEAPVWAWHWAEPEDPRLPWERARKLPLSPEQLMRKKRAIDAHQSQLHPDPDTGAPAVLEPATLARLLQPFELVFI